MRRPSVQTLVMLALAPRAGEGKVGLFYASTSGHTERVAQMIAQKTGLQPQQLVEQTASQLLEYDYLIVGAPTWATSRSTMRTESAWDALMYNEQWGLPTVDMAGKGVAIFGLGDTRGV